MSNSSENVRSILIGLVTNKDFIEKYLEIFEEPVFKGELGTGLIEKWCLSFYKKYGTPVGQTISNAYDRAVREKMCSPEELQYIERLLMSLSDAHDSFTVPTDYLVDIAVEEANRKRLERVQAEVDTALEKGDVSRATEAYERFKRVERGQELPKLSLIDDVDKVADLAMSKDASPFLIPHNAYEEEVFNQLIPGELSFFRAKTKGKKSYAAYEIALCSAISRESTLIFGLGDLSEADSTKRLVSMLLHRPFKDTDEGKLVRVPRLDCLKNIHNTCMNINRDCSCAYKDSEGHINKDYTPCTACQKANAVFPVGVSHSLEKMGKALTKEDITACMSRLKQHMGEGKVFDMYSFSAGQASAQDITNIVKSYFDKGQPIKFIVVDYFAQLKNMPGTDKQPISERVEATAMCLRRLALETGACVLCCDQAHIRTIEGDGDWISDSSYTGGIAKATFAGAIFVANIQDEDRTNNTVKIVSQASRHNSKTFSEGGYVLVCNDISNGTYNKESMYVSPDHIKEIETFKKDNGLMPDKKKKK